ncbi:MAG: hypothetical protein WCX97_01595 [Candidatus Magasanikbacteria bacterium]
MKQKNITIIEEPNVIDDHLLDIIGNEFKFDHEKGIAEWIKNSKDAYTRSDLPDSEQNIILRFVDGKQDDAAFECIDFVGMSDTDIDKAFKRWGDPEAAKRGLKKRVYGGHGNGGKFYMRQMFEKSHFVTYKDGKINIFGFNENRKYGFADGFKNKKANPKEAFSIANIEDLNFPKGVKEQIVEGKIGFTVVRGIGPSKMKNNIKFDKLVEKLKNHPQARRILIRISVWASHNNFSDATLLKPDDIKPLPNFEKPYFVEIPSVIEIIESGEKNSVEMANAKYQVGNLVLKTSEEAFGKGSRVADLNRVDIIGEVGVIASYQFFELGVTAFPQASFIYGECECPILEDSEMDAVKNDRSKLVENNVRAVALLGWLREQVDKYANSIAALEKKEQEVQRRQISAAYNDFLNKWKDRFMSKFMGDLFKSGGGAGGGNNDEGGVKRKILELPKDGFAFSYPYAEIQNSLEERITLKASVPNPIPLGSIIKIEASSNNIIVSEQKITIKAENIKTTPSGDTVAVINFIVIGKKVGEEAQLIATVGKLSTEMTVKTIEATGKDKGKNPKTPQVLLSGIHPDPLMINPGEQSVILSERDPLVYQRYQDVQEGIYWINTQSPLAKAILDRYTDNSIRWRDYLFQRYVDIFVKQMLHELQKRDSENFRADRVDSELDELTRKVHFAAINDLNQFFFEEDFTPVEKL